ncbi:MAG: tetratricopeptide repeat protein, partial [Verrucomicrobiota bacterium]
LYNNQGKYEEAEPLYKRALAIREKQLGADHPDTATSLNNLAVLYYEQGKYKEVEPLYKRALAIKEKQLGADHPGTATTLSNLASLYNNQGKYEEAEPLYKQALAIKEKQLGADHPDTSTFLSNLAGLYNVQGKYEEVEPLYKRALAIREKQLGADHPDTATSLNRLAMFYNVQGKYGEARPYTKRMLLSRTNHWQRMLAYFSETDCLKMARMNKSGNGVGLQKSGLLAARQQLAFKGSVAEAFNKRRASEAELQSNSEGTKLLSIRNDLNIALQQAILTKGVNAPESLKLQEQAAELDKQIAGHLRSDLGFTSVNVSIEEVQRELSDDDTLIESFRYSHKIGTREWESRYSSVVIKVTGDPDFVEHLNAEEIENAVKTYRAQLKHSGDGDVDALQNSEKVLYEKYLTSLTRHLEFGKTVIFSLDSQLHFIPWHMIRDSEGVPFGQKYKVRYVTSGRDLVKKPAKVDSLSAFVLGNPTYRDNAPMAALIEAEEEEAKKLASLGRSMSNDAGNINLTPLPGTAREIDLLSTKLGSKGYEVTRLSRNEATETAVKEGVEGAGIVHLATHGFFLNEIKIERDPNVIQLNGQESSKAQNIQDPMYRSGLALSGAQSTFNLWKNGEVPPPSKDGILMAAEANLLNLRGTDLVVLSACETAAGDALDGEGVMGLRRAFISAGANSTIMTLWPVNDQATVEVMEAFYDKYLNGTHPSIALAEMQNELYEPFVEKYGELEAIAR